jgi:hypothetical protein
MESTRNTLNPQFTLFHSHGTAKRRFTMSSKLTLLNVLVFSALVMSLAAGCGKDDGNGPDPDNKVIPPALVTTWTFQSVTINGYYGSLDEVLEWQYESVLAGFSIEADGKYTYLEIDSYGELSWYEMGTVSISGDNFTFVTTSDADGPVNDRMSGSWSLSGNTLTMTVSEEGDRYVFQATS